MPAPSRTQRRSRVRVREPTRRPFPPAERSGPLTKPNPTQTANWPKQTLRTTGREANDVEPELVDRLHDPDELIHVDRFGDVGVGVEAVALEDVALGLG